MLFHQPVASGRDLPAFPPDKSHFPPNSNCPCPGILPVPTIHLASVLLLSRIFKMLKVPLCNTNSSISRNFIIIVTTVNAL